MGIYYNGVVANVASLPTTLAPPSYFSRMKNFSEVEADLSLRLVEIMDSKICGPILCLVGGGWRPKVRAGAVGLATLNLTLWASLVLRSSAGGDCTRVGSDPGLVTQTSAT